MALRRIAIMHKSQAAVVTIRVVPIAGLQSAAMTISP